MTQLYNELLHDFTQRLQARREELLTDISIYLGPEGRERFRGEYSTARDQGDESVTNLLSDLGIATVRAEATELADIEQALIRISNRTFGACVDCGEAIAIERLQAYPTAKRCLDCQKRKEDRRGGPDNTPSL